MLVASVEAAASRPRCGPFGVTQAVPHPALPSSSRFSEPASLAISSMQGAMMGLSNKSPPYLS